MPTPEELRRLYHEAEVVIVGAGVVGCALAVALGNQGRSVILLERSLKEPDRIVGELLQPGGIRALKALGLLDTLTGIDAIPTYGYEVIHHGESVPIPYPNEEGTNKQAAGTAFHHGRFIRRLRERAMKTENVTVIETTVTGMVTYRREDAGDKEPNQVLGVETNSKETGKSAYFGQLTIVADGYASKWRKEYLPHDPRIRSKFYALELIDADLPAPNHGHVIITDGPPTLLYQIGTHETRALVDVPENLPSASAANGGIKNHLQNVVLPKLPPSVKPSFAAAIEKGSFRSMPNSFLPPATNRTPGLMIIGDALNMRHPLTGGGMTVGLNDVVIIKDLLSPETVPELANTELVLKQLKEFHWKRKNLGSVINILAMALYSLFAANGSFLFPIILSPLLTAEN